MNIHRSHESQRGRSVCGFLAVRVKVREGKLNAVSLLAKIGVKEIVTLTSFSNFSLAQVTLMAYPAPQHKNTRSHEGLNQLSNPYSDY